MPNDRIAGTGGTYFLEATTPHTAKSFAMIYIVSDAVLTTLTQTNSDGTTEDARTTQNYLAATLTQGTLIAAPKGSWYSAVTFASGTGLGIITRNK